MPLKLKETNISNEHNKLKNTNWREADQLAIYKHDRGVELGSTEKQLQLSGLEPVTSGFQVRRPNHSATLPPFSNTVHLNFKKLNKPSLAALQS